MDEVTLTILLHKEEDLDLDHQHRVLLEGDLVQLKVPFEVKLQIIRSTEVEGTIVEATIHFNETMEEELQEILLVVQTVVAQETPFPLLETKIQVPITHSLKQDHLQITLSQEQDLLQITHSAVPIRTEVHFLQTVLQAQILSNHHQLDFKVPQTPSQEQLLHHQIHFKVTHLQQLSTLFTENKMKFSNVFEMIHSKLKNILMSQFQATIT